MTYALSKGDSERGRVVISSSVIFLGAIVIALIPLGVAVSAFVPWNSVFSVGDSEICRSDLTACMIVVIAGTLLQLVLKLVNSLYYAVQRNAAPALLLLISNCLILVAIAFPPPLAGAGALHNFAVLRQALLGNRHILTMVVRMVRNESNRGEWSRLSFAMPAWTEGVVGNYLRDTSLRQFVSQGATSAVPCDLPLIHHLFQYAAGRGLADPEQRLRFPSGD